MFYFEQTSIKKCKALELAFNLCGETQNIFGSGYSVSLRPEKHVLTLFNSADDSPLGLITYRKISSNTIKIGVGGGDVRYRRNGHYTRIWKRFVEKTNTGRNANHLELGS